MRRFTLHNDRCERPRHSSSGYSLASHRGGPGFEPGSGHVGFSGGQSGAGASFLRVLRFPLPILIPPIAPQPSSSIIWGLYNRPEVAAVPRDLVPPHQ
jgi:hypothetical protein